MDSQELTTFITPYGRFQFLRAPYGISSISEHYNRRMAEAFEGLPGYRRIVDDVVIYSDADKSHADHVRRFLQRCAEQKISLNPEKFEYGQEQDKFAGFILSNKGYQIDPEIVRAIAEFPSPSDCTELRSFCGLVNQLTSFTDKLSTILEPLRQLLSTKVDWDAKLEHAFRLAKKALVSAPVFAYFDVSKPTWLYTDASRLHGLGFVLMQQQSDKSWHLVQAGSRMLANTEKRYAVIELEALDVSWAIKKCHTFLAGIPNFQVVIDHKPLVPILNSKQLGEIDNPRLQRICMRIILYQFHTSWIKGKDHGMADVLSRAPLKGQSVETQSSYDDTFCIKSVVLSEIVATGLNFRHEEVKSAGKEDQEYQELYQIIQNGFPEEKGNLPEGLRKYWAVKHRLFIVDDIILLGCRTLIPKSLRKKML